MSKIFLSGARGFIGSHLMPKLISEGHTVQTNFRYFDTDRFDYCVHLAAVTHINPQFDPQMYEANIVLAKKIMSTTAKLIYASSCSAGHLTNPYAYTKRYAEYLGDKHGRAVGMRFFNVYGPNNNKGIVHFLMNQRDGEKIIIRGPELVRDYIHVDDVVEVILAAIEEDDFYQHKVIEVGTSRGTRTIDLVNKFSKISGKKFIVDFGSWGGGNEPHTMVSRSKTGFLSLEEGLQRTIDYDKKIFTHAD